MVDQLAFLSKKSEAPGHSVIEHLGSMASTQIRTREPPTRGPGGGAGQRGTGRGGAGAVHTLRFLRLQLLKLREIALGKLVGALADELEAYLCKAEEKPAAWAHLGHVSSPGRIKVSQRDVPPPIHPWPGEHKLLLVEHRVWGVVQKRLHGGRVSFHKEEHVQRRLIVFLPAFEAHMRNVRPHACGAHLDVHPRQHGEVVQQRRDIDTVRVIIIGDPARLELVLGARTQSRGARGDAVHAIGTVVLKREERRPESLVCGEVKQWVARIRSVGLLPHNAPIGQMGQTPSELCVHDVRPARAVVLIVLVPRRGRSFCLDYGAALARALPIRSVGIEALVSIAAGWQRKQQQAARHTRPARHCGFGFVP
eukprot:2605324-Prymnesium_polylepis.1